MSQTKAELINAKGGADLGGLNIDGSAPDNSVNLDSSGRLLVGTSSAPSAGSGHLIQAADSTGAEIVLGRSSTSVAEGVTLAALHAYSNGGSTYEESASITIRSDGTHAAGDKPGRLVFSTTADGAASPTERMRIQNNGSARFEGTISPLTDNAYQCGSGAFRWSAVYAVNGTIQTSDQRSKTNIQNSTLGSDFVKALNPVSFNWIEGGQHPTGKFDENNKPLFESVPGKRTHWGFIAQEVKQAVDSAGVDFGGWVLTDKDNPDSQQALRYDQFIAPLTKALQEALAEIDVLKAKVAALESA